MVVRHYPDIDVWEHARELARVEGVLDELPDGHVERPGWVGEAREVPVTVEKF